MKIEGNEIDERTLAVKAGVHFFARGRMSFQTGMTEGVDNGIAGGRITGSVID